MFTFGPAVGVVKLWWARLDELRLDTTLIWLDQSSPRLRFFFVGLGVGTVEERPHPKAIFRQGGSPS